MKRELISFIIPAQSSETVLSLTLSSVAEQKTTFAFEIIVVLNQNSDFDHPYPIKKIKTPKRGASHARNEGLKIACGTHIAFVDADTILRQGWIEFMMKAMSEGHWSGVQSKIVTSSFFPESLFDDFRRTSSELTSHGLILANYPFPVLNTAACLYLNVPELVFNEDLNAGEDLDLSWKILRTYSTGFRYVEEATATSFYLPESVFCFYLRNWKLGKVLHQIVSNQMIQSPLFYQRFEKSFRNALIKEIRLLILNPSLGIFLRAGASVVTYINFLFSNPRKTNPPPHWNSLNDVRKIIFNGKALKEEERLISYQGTLRLLNLQEMTSQYFKTHEILLNNADQMLVIGLI